MTQRDASSRPHEGGVRDDYKPGNAKHCQQLPEGKGFPQRFSSEGSPSEPPRGINSAHLDFRLAASSTSRESVSVVLSHTGYGTCDGSPGTLTQA